MTKVGILGSGKVGQTLAKGFARHGYDTRIASRSPEKFETLATATGVVASSLADVGLWADWIVLAVQGSVAVDVLNQAGAGSLARKLIIDVTNPLADAPPDDGVLRVFTGPNESLMERLQDAFPDARFVKAFNSVGHAIMVNPAFPGGRPTMFICGNDAPAKADVAHLLDQFGWEVEDMGTAKAARAIEPLCQLWCIPGLREGRWQHAFKLLRPA